MVPYIKGMWYLKFKYKHSDCIYAPKLQELNLSVFFYYLGHYLKGNYVFTSAAQHLIGDQGSIKKYINYIKNHKSIVKIEVYNNLIFTVAKHKRELEVYGAIYQPIFIYPSPAYLSKDGFEVIEIACWEKEPIQRLIKSLKKNKTTTYFEILSLINRSMEDMYIIRLLPKLPEKQEKAIRLAFEYGYYNFPRKLNLDRLSRIAKVSKPTFRENLRKAESKIIPKLISK